MCCTYAQPAYVHLKFCFEFTVMQSQKKTFSVYCNAMENPAHGTVRTKRYTVCMFQSDSHEDPLLSQNKTLCECCDAIAPCIVRTKRSVSTAMFLRTTAELERNVLCL